FLSTHTPPHDLYTLSLHDALPISSMMPPARPSAARARYFSSTPKSPNRRRSQTRSTATDGRPGRAVRKSLAFFFLILRQQKLLRSEEHTSELQSLRHLVCRLLLEK